MRPDDTSTNVDSPDPERRGSPLAGAAAEERRDAKGAPRPLLSDSVNWIGLETLIRREITRFLKVYGQTVLAHVATSALFLAVFTFALAGHKGDVAGLPYPQFLAPGVAMMSVLQSAFANTSSSIMIAKVQGSIFDTLTPPLSAGELVIGFVAGAVARGLIIAVLCSMLLFPFVGVGLAAPLWALIFALLGATMLGLLGLIAGIWATKFDHVASITNFVVTPLSFLSGSFYSVDVLPGLWASISYYNPFFYLIDGFRYGVLGVSDANPWTGAAVCMAVIAGLWWICWRMFETGYKLKS